MDQQFGKLCLAYQNFLKILLHHRWKTIFVAFIFAFFSLFFAQKLPNELLPAQDQGYFIARFKFPVGTALPVVETIVAKIDEILLPIPEISTVYTSAGGSQVNQAFSFINLVSRNKRQKSQAEMIQLVRTTLKKAFPKIEVIVQDLSLRGFSASRGFPIEILVQGPDWEKLCSYTAMIMAKMNKSGDFMDVNTDIQVAMPQINLVPQRDSMAFYAVSNASVTANVNTLMGGALYQGVSQFPWHQHRYPIELRLLGQDRKSLEDLLSIEIRNNRGLNIPLPKLVKVQEASSLISISRLDRSRAIKVYANPAAKRSVKNLLKQVQVIASETLTPGYSFKIVGNSKDFLNSFQSLAVAMLLGVVVSYMVLGSQFNSFIQPITVLMALPFSFCGAFIALFLGHQSLNLYSIIGLILLMGLVKKNSILLVDFTNQIRATHPNFSVIDALLKACPVRLKPILMTTSATIAAALPEALSIGPTSESSSTMAIGIIGGLLSSTILTLLVVPCVYSLFSKFEPSDAFQASRF